MVNNNRKFPEVRTNAMDTKAEQMTSKPCKMLRQVKGFFNTKLKNRQKNSLKPNCQANKKKEFFDGKISPFKQEFTLNCQKKICFKPGF